MLADKHESMLQIDNMILMEMVKHSRSPQKNKFAMSLQYPKKQVRDDIDFLHADKHQSFLQVDFKIYLGHRSLPQDVVLSLFMHAHDQAFSK